MPFGSESPSVMVPRFGPIGGLAMIEKGSSWLARPRVLVSILDWSRKGAPRFVGRLLSLEACFTFALELFETTSRLSVSQPQRDGAATMASPGTTMHVEFSPISVGERAVPMVHFLIGSLRKTFWLLSRELLGEVQRAGCHCARNAFSVIERR
jgi:hypothetical protein